MSALSGIDIALWDLKGEQPPKIVAIADTAADIKQQDECMCPCMSSWEGLCGSDVKCMPYASPPWTFSLTVSRYCWIGGDRPSDVEAAASAESGSCLDE